MFKGKLYFIILILIIAIFASVSGFVIHVVTVEKVATWVSSQMQHSSVDSSWDVRYVAMVTSIEYGLAACVLYFLLRKKLAKFSKFVSSLIFAILLAAINGAFIRQPLMDFIIGNPIQVVLVQDGLRWLVWLLMSFIIVYGVEFVFKHCKE